MNTLNLARARADLDVATAAVTAAAENVAALRCRASEAAQRRSEALAALRAGVLKEEIAAARMSVADADAADLRGLIATAEAEHGAAVAAQRVAEDAVRSAQETVEFAERTEKIKALDALLADAEQKFVRALALRYSLALQNGAPRPLERHWRPGDALAQAVRHNVPPRDER